MNRILCVHDKPGIEKTVVAKHVSNQFDELESTTSIYLNASALTPNLALKEIYEIVCDGEGRRLPSPLMVRDITKKLLKKDCASAITLDNFNPMDGVENLLWKINHLMESVGRVGLILISTSEFEIRNLISGRLFSRLKPEYYEFKPYNAERLYEIIRHRIKQAYGKLIISPETLTILCDFVAEECEGNARYLFKLFLSSVDITSKKWRNQHRSRNVKEVIDDVFFNKSIPRSFNDYLNLF